MTFRRLDAVQLLKRALGRHYSCGERFTLLYLYVHATGKVGEEHVEELERFARALAGDFAFVTMAYSQLLRRLRVLAGLYHDPYFNYLTARYSVAQDTSPNQRVAA